jgi:hypothetical protein
MDQLADLAPHIAIIVDHLTHARGVERRTEALNAQYARILDVSTDIAIARIRAGETVNGRLAETSVEFAMHLSLFAQTMLPQPTPEPDDEPSP